MTSLTFKLQTLLAALSMSLVVNASQSGFDKASVVKIYSGLCAGDREQFRGSGLLFTSDGAVYAVTSEHVLLQGNGLFCHAVQNDELPRVPAELVQADWGKGLALLKLKVTGAVPAPSIEFLRGQTPAPGTSALTWGYPFRTTRLFSGGVGSVLSNQSDRALIPLVSTMIETHFTHGEYGMSGGPVTTRDGEHFLGVLSHQYLKPKAGGHDEVEEFEVPEVSEDHLLVIPAVTVAAWVKGVLGSGASQPSAIRDPFAQVQGKSEVITHGLRFSFTRPKPVHVAPNGGGDGVGIGGGDGVGIGGGDGVAIGGDGDSSEMRGAGTIGLSLASDGPSTSWRFSSEREAWLERVRELLLRRAELKARFFVERLPGSGGMRKHAITSLAEFFSELLNDELRPVLHIESELSSLPGTSAPDQTLRKDGASLAKALAGLTAGGDSPGALAARQLLEQLSTLASMADSGEWELIDTSWVSDLREGHRPGWSYLFNASYDKTVELLTALIRIQDGIPFRRN